MRKSDFKWADWAILIFIATAALVAIPYVLFGKEVVTRFLTSEVTAAWVQAIGSIGALIGAFVVLERQVLAARKLEADKRHLDDLVKTEVVLTLFSNVYDQCTALQNVISQLPIPPHWRAVRRLKELSRAFQSLPLLEIPGAGVAVGVLQMPQGIDDLISVVEQIFAAHGKKVAATGPTGTNVFGSRIQVEFDRAIAVALHTAATGVSVCGEQINNIKRLHPVSS